MPNEGNPLDNFARQVPLVSGLFGGNPLGFLGNIETGKEENLKLYGDIDPQNFVLPGAAARERQIQESIRASQLRRSPRAPQAAEVAAPGLSSFRGDQQGLIGQLQRRASGEESLSQLQLRQAADQNIAQQRALAASGRPQDAAMSARLAAQNIGSINAGLAGQQSLAGIQERQGAQNVLSNVLGVARAQDQGQGQFAANLAQNRNLANAQFQGTNNQLALQQQQLNDVALRSLLGLGLENATAQQRGGIAEEQIRAQKLAAVANQASKDEALLGMGGSALGFLLG